MSQFRADRLNGLHTAIFTPLDLHGEFKPEHYPALLAFQRNAGTDGVAVCGTNGEGVSLSINERKLALETAIRHRETLTIIAGTGATSVVDAVDLTRHAAASGADAALVLPPFFFKAPSAQGLADYFRSIMDSADIPVLLYNIPQFTAVPITDELLKLLADHPNLAGIKDSAGDWNRTLDLITRYPRLKIFTGSDRLLADGYTHGAAGCISGGANAFPEVLAAVRNAYFADPTGDGARAEQVRFDKLIDITIKYPFISSTKSIIANRGLPRLGVRPPLTILSHEKEQELIGKLRAANFL